MRIKDIPSLERPRERALQIGLEHLSNEDLLAILLGSGTSSLSAKEVALHLLSKLQSLSSLQDESVESLSHIKGIGKVKALHLLASVELGKRVLMKNSNNHLRFTNPKDIFESVRYLFAGKKQECFYALYFNQKQELLERKLLFMGTVNRSVVHPREVFKEAYLLSASSVICIHNHPSGDVTPSMEDIRVTKALIEIGEMNGIPVLDHLVVSDDAYYSFREHGRMEV